MEERLRVMRQVIFSLSWQEEERSEQSERSKVSHVETALEAILSLKQSE